MGILTVELFNKKPPLYNEKPEWRVMQIIGTSTEPPKINNQNKMSSDLQDFIAKCLVVSKDKRKEVNAILQKIQHMFPG